MSSNMKSPDMAIARSSGKLRRLLPMGILAGGIAAFFAFGLDDYLTFDALREHRGELMGFVMQKPVVAMLAFILLYAVATALSLPGGALLTVTAGFLFGIGLGTAATVVGATIGAISIYLAAKTAFRDVLTAKAGSMLQRMEAGFKDNALSYLLVLRLIPIFPFFIVNIVPALLGVPLRTYAIGTLIGIIPGTFVFASIGAGLGSVFDRMEEFSLKGALTPEVTIALIGLAVLSLVPVLHKKFKAR